MRLPRVSRRGWLRSAVASAAMASLEPAGYLPSAYAADHPQGPNRANDVPWLAEVQRRPDVLPADAPHLPPLLMDQSGAKITTLAAWQRRREAIRRWWLDFLGPLASASQAPPRLALVGEERSHGVIRQLVRYAVEPGLPVEAYLLKPVAAAERRPGVAVFHQTVACSIRESAGVEGRSELAFGLELAKRGYVALCPRNFLWPDNRTLAILPEMRRLQARHPKSKGMAKMLFDARMAVDILTGLPDVDPQRIGAVGHSLGAKEVLYLAAFDERVRAAVSSEGGIGTRFSNWNDPWYLGEEAGRPGFTHEHHELLSLVAPRAFLLLGGDSADGARSWPFIEAALPVYALYGQPARLGLLHHRKGHSVPPETATQLYQWLAAYL